jgi:hypothetical protein
VCRSLPPLMLRISDPVVPLPLPHYSCLPSPLTPVNGHHKVTGQYSAHQIRSDTHVQEVNRHDICVGGRCGCFGWQSLSPSPHRRVRSWVTRTIFSHKTRLCRFAVKFEPITTFCQASLAVCSANNKIYTQNHSYQHTIVSSIVSSCNDLSVPMSLSVSGHQVICHCVGRY